MLGARVCLVLVALLSCARCAMEDGKLELFLQNMETQLQKNIIAKLNDITLKEFDRLEEMTYNMLAEHSTNITDKIASKMNSECIEKEVKNINHRLGVIENNMQNNIISKLDTIIKTEYSQNKNMEEIADKILIEQTANITKLINDKIDSVFKESKIFESSEITNQKLIAIDIKIEKIDSNKHIEIKELENKITLLTTHNEQLKEKINLLTANIQQLNEKTDFVCNEKTISESIEIINKKLITLENITNHEEHYIKNILNISEQLVSKETDMLKSREDINKKLEIIKNIPKLEQDVEMLLNISKNIQITVVRNNQAKKVLETNITQPHDSGNGKIFSSCNVTVPSSVKKDDLGKFVVNKTDPAVPITTLTPVQTTGQPQPQPTEECRTPKSLEPCGSGEAAFYYDEAARMCKAANIGGCGSSVNLYRSEEECERRCGAFRGIDVCSYRLDPGPCRAAFPKIYFDSTTSTCLEFTYGGCQGGPNRFSTYHECQDVCDRVEPVSNDVIDCEVNDDEDCEQLSCHYGVNRTTDEDGCERCMCRKPPCQDKRCPEGERCIATPFRDPITEETRYTANCQTNLTRAPEADPDTEHYQPQVEATEGGKATLRCYFHGNPPPKITWRFGELTIDHDTGRYRFLADGALEIISHFRNDSGVYICLAHNEYGSAQQQVTLTVADGVSTPAAIEGAKGPVVGELGQPLVVRCQAYGFPVPTIYWYRGSGKEMVPYSHALYEARGQELRIHDLKIETLGDYVCYAYNGVGKAVTQSVVVQAYRPPGETRRSPYLVEREVLVTPRTPVLTMPTLLTTTEEPINGIPPYTVPVHTSLPAASSVSAGARFSLPCEVDGYPDPEVRWTKDDAPVATSDRIRIGGSRLTIERAEVSDSGAYSCHAANAYNSHSSTVRVTVQEVSISDSFVDNPTFANCPLIVTSRSCTHKYYSKFCCKSCVEAGQLDPRDALLICKPTRKK